MPPSVPAPRDEYTPAAVAACEKALRTLITKIGPWGAQVVLIGGMAPKYLVGSLPLDSPRHIGTTDLDVVVGVALETDEEAAYRTLQKNLIETGFQVSVDPDSLQETTFCWERQVDGVRVALEFFCPVGDGRAGTLRRNPGTGIGSRISAIRMRGAELAAFDYVTVQLDGDTLDGGGIREQVLVKVANVLPFLVLKAFALAERDKDKDAYDIVWTLNAYPDGPAGVVSAAMKSPVISSGDILPAMAALADSFATPAHSGPARYARFQAMDRNDAEEAERLCRFAHGTVKEFFREWEVRKVGREPVQ